MSPSRAFNKPRRLAAFVLTASASSLFSPLAIAESQVGDTVVALPGIHRVPIAGTPSARVGVGADGGYGFTESQHGEGAHHRALGLVGLGVGFASGLELGAIAAARHDRHPADALGADSDTTTEMFVLARFGRSVARELRLGGDLTLSFPGAESAADSLVNPAVDARASLAWLRPGGTRIAGFAGYRYDRRAKTAENAESLRDGDRMALGVSEYDAVLVGLGAAVPLGRFELLFESTSDIFIADGGLLFERSPVRLDAGARYAISSTISAELLTEVVLGGASSNEPSSPLTPLEPRSKWLAGLRYRFGEPAQAAPVRPQTTAPRARQIVAPPAPPPEPEYRLAVTVVDESGHPLSDAVVELRVRDATHELAFESGSTFVAEKLPAGDAELTVRAERLRDHHQSLKIGYGHARELSVTLSRDHAIGQIRGLVRTFAGTGLSARVTIEPPGIKTQADANGAFHADVPPGTYQILITAPGYATQRRRVVVKPDGVVVLNVDLERAAQ